MASSRRAVGMMVDQEIGDSPGLRPCSRTESVVPREVRGYDSGGDIGIGSRRFKSWAFGCELIRGRVGSTAGSDRRAQVFRDAGTLFRENRTQVCGLYPLELAYAQSVPIPRKSDQHVAAMLGLMRHDCYNRCKGQRSIPSRSISSKEHLRLPCVLKTHDVDFWSKRYPVAALGCGWLARRGGI